ncbi:MAG TPA: Nif3-like dinuclear metal center hexameric protein, partial [Vicinamibacteria bacterium]
MRATLALAFAFTLAEPGSSQELPAAPAATLTARQIVERIQERAGGRNLESWRGPTVDTLKAGDLDTPVTGIVTTFSATMEVLQKAVASEANLIVAHEPTFYDHLDETAWLGADAVLQEKLAFIQKHKLVVWRFHDHAHSVPGQPDLVLKGMVAGLGWQAFQSPGNPYLFTMPEIRLEDLAREMKKRLGIRTLRVVGARNLKVTRIALAPGAAGRERQIKALAGDVEVLVVGESREWETVLYVVDAIGQGRRKALILMGHDASE